MKFDRALNIRKQFEWWKRQHCSSNACQFESEIPGFIHTMEKLLTTLENIANQELIIEMENEGVGDIEYGYDAIIEVSRAAINDETLEPNKGIHDNEG